MAYPRLPDFKALASAIEVHAQVKHEYGADGVERILAGAERDLKRALGAIIDP